MQKLKKVRYRWRLLVVVLFTIPLFYLTISLVNIKTPEQFSWIETINHSRGYPTRLLIPSIAVSASIQYIGINSKGEMAVPSNVTDVGWFRYGFRPGEKGSAVVAGHFNGPQDEEGVFTNLHKLQKGDKIYVETADEITTFVVRESRYYDSGYANDVFKSSDSEHLNLVTCFGEWNKDKNSYAKRLVVFSDMVK